MVTRDELSGFIFGLDGERLHIRRARRPSKLSNEQRKMVFAPVGSNAGAGWRSRSRPADPREDDEVEWKE